MKALYCGDNLQVLRDSIATESVDLIYLDPPFNSKANYNVGLLGQSGRDRMRGRTAACSHKAAFARMFISVGNAQCGDGSGHPSPASGCNIRSSVSSPPCFATRSLTVVSAVTCHVIDPMFSHAPDESPCQLSGPVSGVGSEIAASS